MATVKVTEAAAPVHVDQKPKFTSVHDSRGRTIQLRKLDPLQQSRIVRACGDESSNTVFMNGFALPCAMVAFIDDDMFGLPGNITQIESMLSILGDEGMTAVTDT